MNRGGRSPSPPQRKTWVVRGARPLATSWEVGGAEKQRTCRTRRSRINTRRRRLLWRWAGGRGAQTRRGVETAAATAGQSVSKPVAVGQRPSPHGAAFASAVGLGWSKDRPYGRTVGDRPRHKF